MNAFGLTLTLFLAALVLLAPRRWALLGMMAGVLYLTQGQQLRILGLNFYAVRFLELAGFVRVIGRREFSIGALNGMDRAFLLVYAYTTLVFLLRSTEDRANMIGVAGDAILCYFTFRGLIGDVADFRWFLSSFVILLAPFVLLVIIEKLTHQNLFSLMGGVANEGSFRGDSLRCQGSFRHPTLMGTLGATFFPLYLGLAFTDAGSKRAWLGIALCLVIVGASNSGGPLGATTAGLIAWLFWTVRTKMRLMRWGMVGGFALTALVMKAPVWYLIARASSVTGGDGWHRAYLLDRSFQLLDQWWFAGVPIVETADWLPYSLSATGGADITNQFLSFGLNAGLAAVVLYVLLLSRVFSRLGKSLAAVRASAQKPDHIEHLLWGLGAMLTAHVVNMLGICYWDQIYVVWFMQLAAIANLTEPHDEPMHHVTVSAPGVALAEEMPQPTVRSAD